VHVVAPEVDQLARRVDLRLVDGLRLTQDRRGVDGGPPRPGEQVGGPEEDRRAVIEGQLTPPRRRLPGRGDGLGDVVVGRRAQLAEHVPVVVRLDHVDALARAHPVLAAHGHGQLGALSGQFLDPVLERRTLRASRRVAPDRLVHRKGDVRYGIHRG
jgi:hypothetical protein